MQRCTAQKEFVLGFQQNILNSDGTPEGRVYVVNPSPTAIASVTVTTPLITQGAAAVDESFTVAPRGAEYVTVPYDAHMLGSKKENKGAVCPYRDLL